MYHANRNLHDIIYVYFNTYQVNCSLIFKHYYMLYLVDFEYLSSINIIEMLVTNNILG